MVEQTAIQTLPERIGRLGELAYNLWWSWQPRAREVFRALDYPMWKTSGHNPVKQLREISPDRLQASSTDARFLALYDLAMAGFDDDMSSGSSWFADKYPNLLSGPVAYFSAEFAIHNSLPIYAGGLGILAGDTCKEASDSGLPMVGVGLMYPQGYFQQRISADGWQEEIYRQLDFSEAPIKRVLSPTGEAALAEVQLDGRSVALGVWQVRVGRTTLYLLDANIDSNAPQDRQLSARLYIADRELRIEQEIILGIGGVRVLRALGIRPSIWHANEGHTAFMMLERVREEVERGVNYDEATRRVRANTVFTTHTPVPAGHDTFPVELVEKYFRDYWTSLGIDRDRFIQMGNPDGRVDSAFNMAGLALRTADRCNAVSQLHGRVSRRMWHILWPQAQEDEVPISHVPNGVHVPTWVAPEIVQLYEKYLGRDWIKRHDDTALWEGLANIPDDELWAVHLQLKRKLGGALLRQAQERWTAEATAQQTLTMGSLLDPDILTIGFVRRFAEYKRPSLIFHDIERLKRIVGDPRRPVQIVFAGKSHPADFPAKYLLHEVYSLAMDRSFQGRIAFVEDYNMHMARYLAPGLDLWLNTPRRLQEACGTSGMKASLNGVPHLSVLDGWWYEGYNGANGWAIGDASEASSPEEEDEHDAAALYDLLEQQIVPLYYNTDSSGVPHGWIHVVKEAIRSVAPGFSARRMLKSYIEQMYVPAVRAR